MQCFRIAVDIFEIFMKYKYSQYFEFSKIRTCSITVESNVGNFWKTFLLITEFYAEIDRKFLRKFLFEIGVWNFFSARKWKKNRFEFWFWTSSSKIYQKIHFSNFFGIKFEIIQPNVTKSYSFWLKSLVS